MAQVANVESEDTANAISERDIAKESPNSMQYTLTGPDGKPLAGIAYKVTFLSGITAQGITDEQGRTVRFRTKSAERLSLAVKSRHARVSAE
ncbi:hypothetical protein [Paraburkholderia sacchari]|uniref:hypothetical protein n=1 Tax=Paraburkholderia sacchari TaxID=159450 RepID=UPI0039A5FAED